MLERVTNKTPKGPNQKHTFKVTPYVVQIIMEASIMLICQEMKQITNKSITSHHKMQCFLFCCFVVSIVCYCVSECVLYINTKTRQRQQWQIICRCSKFCSNSLDFQCLSRNSLGDLAKYFSRPARGLGY